MGVDDEIARGEFSRLSPLSVLCPVCSANVGRRCRDVQTGLPLPPMRNSFDDSPGGYVHHYGRTLAAEIAPKDSK